MPDAPTPLDLDAIRAMLGDRLAVTTRSVALDLLAEVERLRAEVARPAPTWDEEAIRAARDEYVRHNLGMAVGTYGDRLRCAFEAGVDAVRDHLPVKPDREAVIEAMSAALNVTTDRIPGLNPGPVLSADCASVVVAADAVLDLLPGRSEAEVKAEALREAADWLAHEYGNDGFPGPELRARADRLAAEGGAS